MEHSRIQNSWKSEVAMFVEGRKDRFPVTLQSLFLSVLLSLHNFFFIEQTFLSHSTTFSSQSLLFFPLNCQLLFVINVFLSFFFYFLFLLQFSFEMISFISSFSLMDFVFFSFYFVFFIYLPFSLNRVFSFLLFNATKFYPFLSPLTFKKVFL